MAHNSQNLSEKSLLIHGPKRLREIPGANNGYVRKFRNNNGTGTPIQLAGNTWYLISFSYGPGISRDHFVANAYVDGKRSVADFPCIAQDGATPWDVETHLHRLPTENTSMGKSQRLHTIRESLPMLKEYLLKII